MYTVNLIKAAYYKSFFFMQTVNGFTSGYFESESTFNCKIACYIKGICICPDLLKA